MHQPDLQGKSENEKKPYVPPRLSEYGSITKLTQSTGTVLGDGPGPMML